MFCQHVFDPGVSIGRPYVVGLHGHREGRHPCPGWSSNPRRWNRFQAGRLQIHSSAGNGYSRRGLVGVDQLRPKQLFRLSEEDWFQEYQPHGLPRQLNKEHCLYSQSPNAALVESGASDTYSQHLNPWAPPKKCNSPRPTTKICMVTAVLPYNFIETSIKRCCRPK